MNITEQLNDKLADASAELDASRREVDRIKFDLKAAKKIQSEHQDTVNMLANNIRELRDGEYQPGLFGTTEAEPEQPA